MDGPFTELDLVNPRKLSAFIINLMNQGEKDEAIIVQIQTTFLLNNDDAHFALEYTRTGLFRASMFFSGKSYPIHDNDPLTNTAFQMGLEQLERERKSAKRKKWWKFWKIE